MPRLFSLHASCPFYFYHTSLCLLAFKVSLWRFSENHFTGPVSTTMCFVGDWGVISGTLPCHTHFLTFTFALKSHQQVHGYCKAFPYLCLSTVIPLIYYYFLVVHLALYDIFCIVPCLLFNLIWVIQKERQNKEKRISIETSLVFLGVVPVTLYCH